MPKGTDYLLTNTLARPRLLIVDDQTVNIRVLHEIFNELYDVFMATSGESALQQVTRFPPDLILLDVMMPGIDGLEVCRRLKASEETAHIPVIFITAHHQVDDELAGFEAGAVDFISKPINPVIVKVRVNTHMALKRQSDLLKSIAMVDGLTGVANRRRFDEVWPQQCRFCQEIQQPLTLMMIDVDFFKRYNDAYGHQAGDDALRKVASTLSQTFEGAFDPPAITDPPIAEAGSVMPMVARYGGEEFACILPGVDHEGARHWAERLLNAIRALHISHQGAPKGYLTLSLGVAVTTSGQMAAQALIEQADQALYECKAAGRDNFCLHDEAMDISAGPSMG
ncbi:hypothetical protein BFW38_14900 [Terasakiispira papahanaumokuakeensis]|uniref:diguanylate cyclase n=2 Tax=Terasakiispira papahanaumokuakeensis TaxID=197479 RepID=A0A1E2VEV4_9GAMM|nr:hypothetical protein BFW38_14900 [Terasakiispira papahanaumokuakeensis]